MRWLLRGSVLLAAIPVLAAQMARPVDPAPATLDEFKAAVTRILDETGIPGAGLALVRASGVEWAGGVGVADRDTRRPVDADTMFRVGSISKSFVAMALVQLYEDGQLDLDAPIASIIPEVRIDNPWHATTPVRIRHLLEHTAGFDDMHFNEIYVLDGAPDRPLDEVLLRNPASRRVRWPPGTRMAYSNPGYAVAGRVIEAVAGKPFDQFIRERIFTPLAMTESTFSGDLEAPSLAQGYAAKGGPPVARRRIHLRPAGAMHSSPRELGLFVEMLLNWGELRGGYVIDPEYLSNMEWPRTTAASTAGVRVGYGLGISSTIDLPHHVLGHQGGIDGFVSMYGYSPSRDVGFVVLLNATYAPGALKRIASLAISYLKRDVEATPGESMAVPPDALRRFEGYYHDANPRNAALQAVEFPLAGRTVTLEDGRLVMSPVFGVDTPLIPVNDALFRREHELTASLAFTDVEGTSVLTGPSVYAERRARWPLDVLRGSLLVALAGIALAPPIATVYFWVRRRRGGAGTRGLGSVWTVALLALAAFVTVASTSPVAALATASGPALVLFGASIVYPLAAFALLPLTAAARVRGLRGPMGSFAVATAAAHTGLACYLTWWGLVAFRSWTY